MFCVSSQVENIDFENEKRFSRLNLDADTVKC